MKKPDNKNLTIIDGALITRNGIDGCLEASDLQRTCKVGRATICERIWNDAFDQGFWVRSHRTGRLELFTLTDVEKDVEGDVLCWIFRSVREDGKGRRVSVKIFND